MRLYSDISCEKKWSPKRRILNAVGFLVIGIFFLVAGCASTFVGCSPSLSDEHSRIHNNAYTEEEVEDYLSQFIISMNNSSLVKVAIDIFLHEVIVDYDPENKTKK